MEAIRTVTSLMFLLFSCGGAVKMKKSALVCVMFFVSLVMLIPLEDVRAATITTGAMCTLVDAIESANTNAAVGGCAAGAAGQDTIIVTGGVVLTAINNGSGSNANGLPVITEDLTLRSSAPGIMRSIQRSTAAGIPEFRIMEIGGAAPSVTLRGLSLRFGKLIGSPPVAGVPVGVAGGCIKMGAGNLTIVDSLIEECSAQGADNVTTAGGDASGGAIYAANGSLTVINTTLSFNSAMGGATTAGGFAGGSAQGGGVFATGLTLEMVDSTVVSNFALGGDGVDTAGIGKGGGIVFYGLEGSITRSLIIANASSGGISMNSNSALSIGGGLVVQGATLTLDTAELLQNVANGKDSVSGLGGYAYGGGLYSSASTLELRNATVGENRVSAGNGTVGNFNGLAWGGGLYLTETATTIKFATIEENSASGARARGGGIYEFNTDPSATPLEISNSTLDGNVVEATFNYSHGGGIYQDVGTTAIRNSTLSNNTADYGGAVAVDGGESAAGISMEIANVTVSGNVANQHGGGLYIAGSAGAPNVTMTSLYNATVTNNTNSGIRLTHDLTDPELVAANTIIGAQASGVDCSVDGGATLTSGGGNLESGISCSFTNATDQQSVLDLGLATLSDFGGKTFTHALLPDSPAIESGKKRICNQQTNKKDQRGLARFYDGAGGGTFDCDSGSVEYQGLLANPGFEDPLDPANDWTLVASGGGDARLQSRKAPSGKYGFVFQANGALENASQEVALEGGAGDTYTVTLLGAGQSLIVGESMSITIEAKNTGSTIDTQACTFTWASSNFPFGARDCALTTTGAYDSIKVIVGWDAVSAGSMILDAVSLTQ